MKQKEKEYITSATRKLQHFASGQLGLIREAEHEINLNWIKVLNWFSLKDERQKDNKVSVI